MRVPTQERRPFKLRGWMIAIVVILLVLLFSLRGLAVFYTDYLWFDSLGQSGTWSGLLGAKIIPSIVFTVVFLLILLANLLIADRLAPKVRGLGPATPEDEIVVRYQQSTARYQGRIRVGIALFFALIAGIGVAAQWREWVLFTNRVDFHIEDPQFHRDVGFYVFQLPFIKFMIDWLFAGLVIVLLVTAVAHYLNGGIRFQSPLQRVTPQVKAHISVILAVMALVKTADYFFSRYELNFSDRGTVDGATYTDINAQLPALEFLTIVSVIAALLFLWNIWRRGWVLPVIAVGLWAFVSLIVGTIYPAAIQNFKVKPDEFATERKFIKRNIEATRNAFGLANVTPAQFDFTDLQQEQVATNLSTIDNARIWDPETILSPFEALQGFQSYYRINDVDVDRYLVDGQVSQVMIASRDLNSGDLPNQSWVNEHLIFTHGYGAVASPSTQTDSGNPTFYVSDVPTKNEGIELRGKGAEVYFAEKLDEYVIVNGDQSEFNYARQGQRGDAQNRYNGKDGVELSNVIRRAAFALRFGDPNPLISGQVNSESKVLMVRDVRDRAQKLAPFLKFDDDPYPVVVDNKLLWILDGYTTSDMYPYSQLTPGEGGLDGEFNYARNSVKATVDAYNGDVTFYVIDRKDPLIRAYGQAFPDLFTPQAQMPDAVRDHLRYPEDLFTVQTDVFGKYHVTDARRFYRQSERWLRSPDPIVTSQLTGNGSGRRNANRSPEINATTERQAPYYLYIRLPEDDEESFLLMQPFVPVSEGQQTRLSSFMTAKSDPQNYGELELFVMPPSKTVQGPAQVANAIDSDQNLSPKFSLLNQEGSTLVKGNLQLIPVGDSIVYIQPIYVQRKSLGYPQFQFVVAFTENRAPTFGANVAEAVNNLFGITTSDPTEPGEPTTDNRDAEQLLADAAERFAAAEAALKEGDLEAYAQLEAEGRDLVAQALRLLQQGDSGSEPTTAPTAEQASAR
ncbi:MAG: UPF0182 family protein [Acidimicrobiia bacterium]